MNENITLSQVMKEIDPLWEKKLQSFRISSGYEIFQRMYADLMSGKRIEQLNINWRVLTKKFGGFRMQELTVLTGDTGMGKTTWAVNVLYLLLENKVRCFCFSLEMGPQAIIKKLFRMHTGSPLDYEGVKRGHEKFSEISRNHHLLLMDGQEFLKFQDFKTLLAWAAMNRQCKFFLIDHFEMVADSNWDAMEIGRAVAEIRSLAYKLDIHIMLICHPRKRGTNDSAERQVEMHDMKGSSGIIQFADNVFSIFFDKKEKTNRLKLHKIRDDEYGRYQGDEISYTFGDMTLTFWEGE